MSSLHDYTNTNTGDLSNIPTGILEKHRAAPAHGGVATGPMSVMNFDHPMSMQQAGTIGMMHNMKAASAMAIDGTSATTSAPNLLMNKPRIEVIPSKLTNARGVSASPCQELPCYLVPNHFVAKQPNYKTIETSVNYALEKMSESYRGCLDFSYFKSQCQVSRSLCLSLS